MAEKIVPKVKADEPEEPAEEEEELVDPLDVLREECHEKPEMQSLWAKYLECNDRVNSKKQTAETCEEELVSYCTARDKCVNKDLFKRLK